MRGKIVCALFTVGCCAFGQGLLRCKEGSSRPVVPETARQACAKVPEEHRKAVESEIGKMAYTEATREAGEKFGLLIMPDNWTNTCGKGLLLFSLDNCRFLTVQKGMGPYKKYAPDGRLVQYGSRTNFEELVWCDRRRDELVVQFWNDRAIVDAALSNAVAAAEKMAANRARGARPGFVRKSSSSSFGRLLKAGPQQGQGLLEELVPLEEAMALAKAGKGKGFYQLALRYARGEGLPQDDAAAYRMLCKARDMDYAHAVLVEGLCDERCLRCPNRRYAPVAECELRTYCGAFFRDGRRWGDYDSLTNAVAVARIMGKYEKAKRLGALVATNQIAALNKRLSDFKAEETKRLQAEENARRVAGLLPEAQEAAEARERAAAEREQQMQELHRIQEELRRQREQRQKIEMQTAVPVAPNRSSLADLRARRAQKAAEREAQKEELPVFEETGKK